MPACTELEVVMMDWLAKALELPNHFLSGGKGGGIIKGTASECTLVGLLAALSKMVDLKKKTDGDLQEYDILSRLVAYTSDQAHSSVVRACILGAVKCHLVASDDNCCMHGNALQKAIAEDRAKDLIPFYVVATLGTTPSCAFDNLTEVGLVCEREGLWLHIDVAYAGSAFICPEFRPLLNGIEYADSFNFNPHKWMLVNFDCSAMWFQDVTYMVTTFRLDPLYVSFNQQHRMPDFRHWQIPFCRRFRSLKLWFVFRTYGIRGIQGHIRKHVRLAHEFEQYMKDDNEFEVTNEVILGLVCFRLKDKPKKVNEVLLKRINADGRIHLVPAEAKGIYFLRFVVCSPQTESADIKYSYDVIREIATKLLTDEDFKDYKI